MTVRTKDQLKAQIAALIDSAGTPRVSAEDVRDVLDDFVDSLDTMVAAEGQSLLDRITDALGSATWQQGAGQVTGVTLAQALAAVQISDTPVDHIRLTVDRTNANRITISLESVSVHVQTRYAAWSPDDDFTEMEWEDNSNTSETAEITFPETIENHYKGFAIPASEASLTSIMQVGNPFDERDAFAPAVGDADVLVDINGVAHKTYIALAPDFSGPAVMYELR